ncbi:MAG TPA: hypothetical protein VMR98_06155, partial [Candidatus Polarisedimenticolaceae bacterium]|nr:hypothetical protein [Candidatus Polarisedimenticolaceae bacterium]
MPPSSEPVNPAPEPVSPAPAPAPPSDRKGLAVASLVLGVLSILLAIFSFIDLPLALAAIAAGFPGRKSSKAGLAKAGMVLGIIGAIASLTIGILAVRTISDLRKSDSSSRQVLKFTKTSTDCYSFSAVPTYYANDTKPGEFCGSVFNLSGTKDANGKITITGYDDVFGQLQVEAVRSSVAAGQGKTLDEIMASLQKSYFPSQGTPKGKPELIKLDGVPAYKLSLQSNAKDTVSKDFIVSLKTPPYSKAGVDPVNLFIISLATPED